jgi:hypothetical protein
LLIAAAPVLMVLAAGCQRTREPMNNLRFDTARPQDTRSRQVNPLNTHKFMPPEPIGPMAPPAK